MPRSRSASVPPASSEAARLRMQRTRRRDTAPEVVLRSLLFRMGLRFRVDAAPIAGLRRRADLVFVSARVAVYVDGCFWHGCPRHGTWPKLNAAFWRQKIEGNRQRDADTNRRLAREGWRAIRVWEHADPARAAQAIARLVRARIAKRGARS